MRNIVYSIVAAIAIVGIVLVVVQLCTRAQNPLLIDIPRSIHEFSSPKSGYYSVEEIEIGGHRYLVLSNGRQPIGIVQKLELPPEPQF